MFSSVRSKVIAAGVAAIVIGGGSYGIAAATSSSSTLLSWNTATISGNGAVSGYSIFEDGHQLATTTDTHYTVTGLTADTGYQFTVAAIDSAGSSAEVASTRSRGHWLSASSTA